MQISMKLNEVLFFSRTDMTHWLHHVGRVCVTRLQFVHTSTWVGDLAETICGPSVGGVISSLPHKQPQPSWLHGWWFHFPSQPFPTLEGNSFASHARLPCLVFERTHSKEASKQNWKSPKSRFHLHKLCTTKEKINVCDNTEGVRRRNKQTPPAFFPHRALSFEPWQCSEGHRCLGDCHECDGLQQRLRMSA